jgi:hypothetical protein
MGKDPGRVRVAGARHGIGTENQKKAEQGWKGRNRRSNEEALGGDPQSRKTGNEDNTGEEEDVTETKGCVAGKLGKSKKRKGSETGGSVIQGRRAHLARRQRLPDHPPLLMVADGCNEPKLRRRYVKPKKLTFVSMESPRLVMYYSVFTHRSPRGQ